MARQLGPETVVARISERLPEIAQQLPQLPDLLATANYDIRRLTHLGNQQADAIAALQAELDARARHNRNRNWLGAALAVTGVALLRAPVQDLIRVAATQTAADPIGFWPLILGIISLAVGSALLIRA